MRTMPHWMRRFHEEHGVWPIAGGNGEEDPPEPGEQEEEGEQDDNPRIKELSDEAAKYRVRAKTEKDRADAVATELRTARVELAVRREAAKRAQPFADIDVVLKVLDAESIATDDDGQPVEVGSALDLLADRHPYLLAEHKPTAGKVDPKMHTPSGTSMNSDKNKGKGGIDRKALESKFPALRRTRTGSKW